MMLVQKKQLTVARDKKEMELIARGRHDPCVVPRGMFLFDRSNLIHHLGPL
jgi:chorismate synthase